MILFGVVFVTLGIQWLTRNSITLFNRSHLIIAIDQGAFQNLNTKLHAFLKERLQGLRLETTSVVDGRVSLHYQYHRKAGFDGAVFARELNELAENAKIEVFIS